MKLKRHLRLCRRATLFIILMAMSMHAQHGGRPSARVALSHALPALDGNKLAVHLVEVTYGPGEASPAHSHPCPVIAYVAQGEIRSQVEGQPEAVYKTGESFYEAPNGIHAVSANASQTKPAKLIAFFVCDHTAPLSSPAEPNLK